MSFATIRRFSKMKESRSKELIFLKYFANMFNVLGSAKKLQKGQKNNPSLFHIDERKMKVIGHSSFFHNESGGCAAFNLVFSWKVLFGY